MTTPKSTPPRDGLSAALTAVVAASVISVAALPAAAQCQGFKVFATDPAEDQAFGFCVAIDAAGQVALAGSQFHHEPGKPFAGAAYAFFPDGTGWSSPTQIIPADLEDHDSFGQTVSISADGNTMLIGSLYDDSDGLNQGAGYVFTWNGSAWVYQAQLFSPDSTFNAQFGNPVALSADGNIAVIGARLADTIYVFTRTGATWSFQQMLESERGPFGFGESIAISASGQVIAIGAPGYGPGAVVVFTYSGASWEESQAFDAKDLKPNANFGYRIAINAVGTRLLVGTNDFFSLDPGSAYVFDYDGRTWSQTIKLTPPDATSGSLFGFSVALHDDIALIGAPREHVLCPCVSDSYESGAAYLYHLERGEWTLIQKLFAADADPDAQFGYVVALSGTHAMIGALSDDQMSEGGGAVYLFDLADLCSPVIDVVSDGVVNGIDLGILLGSWSSPPGSPACGGTVCCPSDLNDDCTVNGQDLAILLGSWG